MATEGEGGKDSRATAAVAAPFPTAHDVWQI